MWQKLQQYPPLAQVFHPLSPLPDLNLNYLTVFKLIALSKNRLEFYKNNYLKNIQFIFSRKKNLLIQICNTFYFTYDHRIITILNSFNKHVFIHSADGVPGIFPFIMAFISASVTLYSSRHSFVYGIIISSTSGGISF